MEVTWTELKQFVDSRHLSIQWIQYANRYYLYAFDGAFKLLCTILITNPKNTDQTEFETNYQTSGNQSPKSEVVTQFEKDDKILQLACACADVGLDGYATIEIKVPGTYSAGPGRWVHAGRVWFDPEHVGDKVEKVEVVDKDGTIAPPGYVIRKWHDVAVEEVNRGWYIPIGNSGIEVQSLGGYGYIPGGLYLRVKAKKGEAQTTGKLFLNLKWGEEE
jgi:hypothetical protein